MMPNAISSMNPPRKRDHDDELHTLNRNLKSARLDSSDHLSMLVSQGNVMQPMLAPNPMNTYAPSSSSFPLYQTMTTVEGPPFSMHAHLLHHDMQNPLMPAGLLTSMPQTLSHENLTHVFDGSELTLDTTDQSSSPYFNTTSPIDENSLVSPTMQRAPDGFPSPETFEFVLDDYITSLSPKKRDKALIPQKRYDNILRVLRDPKCTTIESAQFRFWAKKMFKLGPGDQSTMGDVVTHEGKPVAVRENLYRVLTNAHAACQHGGRDKTSSQVRKHYSWVPKELIARFVRHCPTCAIRRHPPQLPEPLMNSGLGVTLNNNSQHQQPQQPHHHQNYQQLSAPPHRQQQIQTTLPHHAHHLPHHLHAPEESNPLPLLMY